MLIGMMSFIGDYQYYYLRLTGLGKKNREEVHSGKYDSGDFFEGSGKSSFERPIKAERVKFKTFSENSFRHWWQYACGVCKHLVFRRDMNTWVCGKGHLITKEYCVDFVDDSFNIRIRMPDGQFMYLSES
jgi:hypothetical protein